MLTRRLFAALFGCSLMVAAAAAQDKPVMLAWKLEKDKAFYQEMTTDTKQTMKVMGSDITQTQKQTFIFSWTPEKQEADKSWTVKQKIEGVKMEIDIGGNKIAFDSTKDTTSANPLADFFKALVGSEFSLTLSPEMKVTKITGREDFIKKLTNANPQMKSLLEQILSEDSLREMSNPAFGAVPNKEVKKGDTWTSKSVLNMGPIGTYDITYTYTYEGMQDKLHKIGVASKLEYKVPTATAGGSLPFKIKSADLKSEKATGTILFDADKGRVESSNTEIELKGKLSIEINNMTTDVELSQTQQVAVKTTDANPIKK